MRITGLTIFTLILLAPIAPGQAIDVNAIGELLEAHFQKPADARRQEAIARHDEPLTREQAANLSKSIWNAWPQSPEAKQVKTEIDNREILVNGESLRFTLENMLEEKPENGYPLFIVMHGGGQTAPQNNDRAWRGIQGRYKVKGKYLCPRAPRDTWDHWHNEYIHAFYHKLIEGMILHEEVDPNKVYVMGYSSGGYGTFQLAPILADRWAAAAVAAAGPTSARAENLRNLPFNLQVGTQDTAHGRIEVATQFAEELAKLHAADPAGYVYEWIPHEGRGHGIDDRSSVDWMVQFTRNPVPDKVVWVQGYDTPWRESNPSRRRFYWLATRPDYQRVDGRTDSVTAEIRDQTITLTVEGFETLRVRLNDHMLDLDQPVTILVNGEKRFEGKPTRTLAAMLETFEEYHDPNFIFTAQVEVEVGE